MSAGKMLGLLYGVIGLIGGGIITLFSFFGSAFSNDGGSSSIIFGIGAIILLPLVYGGLGFIGGLISGWIYNLVARIAGGIQIELVDVANDVPSVVPRPDNQTLG